MNHQKVNLNYLIKLFYLDLSKFIFLKFVEKDNEKIVSIIKNIFYIYHKYLRIKIQYYFFQFYIKALKIYNNLHKVNIHNKLFNDYKKRKKNINELKYKIEQNEEKNCTFSPKINSNSNNYNIYFLERINKINNQESLYDIIKNYSSSNNNEYFKNNFIINQTNSFKELNNFRNTNPIFYPRTVKNKQNGNNKGISENVNFKIGRNNRKLQSINNFNTNKEYMPINYIILNDINNIKKLNKYNLVLNNFKDNEIKDYNKRNNQSNNKSNNNLIKKEVNNNGRINNKLNNIKIENNNKENGYIKYFNFIELNKKRKNKLRNKTFNKHNKFELKKEKSSQYFCANTNIYNKLLKNNKSKILLNESKEGNDIPNKSNIEQEDMDIFLHKFFPNKNYLENEKNIFIYRNENDFEEGKIKNAKNERSNSLKKNYSIYINPIGSYNPNEKNEIKRLKQEFDKKNNLSLSKNNKSLSSININKNKSRSFANNSITKSTNIIKSIKEIDDTNLINKNNNNLLKIEYFYTFRNKKVPYNTFKYFSKSNSMLNTSKNNIKFKSKNDLLKDYKTSIKKNNNVISVIEKPKSKINKNKLYHLNNNINSIYSNDYNKKNIITNKESNENIKSKTILNNNTYSIGKIKPSINTINTNNDTKGYSSSTLSAKEIQFIKSNSKRESKESLSNKNISEYKKSSKKLVNDCKNKNKKINKKNELNYNSIYENKIFKNLKINSKVESICFKEKEKINNVDDSILKHDKSMTLQTISDSKMLELAEHYIDSKDDCLDDIGIKKILFKKPLKDEDIDFKEKNGL